MQSWRKPFHYGTSSANCLLKAACAKDAFVSSYFIDSEACTTFTCHRLKKSTVGCESDRLQLGGCVLFYSTVAVICSFTLLCSSNKDAIVSENADVC